MKDVELPESTKRSTLWPWTRVETDCLRESASCERLARNRHGRFSRHVVVRWQLLIAGVVDVEQLQQLLDGMELDAGGTGVVLSPALFALEAEPSRTPILTQGLELGSVAAVGL